ncbi:hypothetical protein QAD02_005409 [Eretmocerus hayati]|uniref:Uncharacterized protein n=1 Tax=Eretmocerus hayati TaxID=131215 RepID=A0ACC2NSU8_9HYME|nr:hypothetical protein QAD02_005409 [Eretmocerus hayati]
MAQLRAHLLITLCSILISGCLSSELSVSSDGIRPPLKCVGDMSRKIESHKVLSTTKMIQKYGYPAEEHLVKTEDGYFLVLHRIPGLPGSSTVFLQHGMLSSSFDWVVSGRNKSLALLLSDKGYDVWLGNARGNMYSQCHDKYSSSQHEFWDFSWHEMGIYDLPAVINYITNQTHQNMTYIGHSMGTTMFCVMATKKPEIASKVKAMFGLSPVVYLSNTRSVLFSIAKVANLEGFMRSMHIDKFFPRNSVMEYYVRSLCHSQKICEYLLHILFGYSPVQFNSSLLPMILSHVPAGTSVKSLLHYHQVVRSGRFAHYDYGSVRNAEIYNSSKSPNYDLSKIEVPIGVFWSAGDILLDPKDVKKFFNQIRNKIFNHKIENNAFNHVDYLWAKDADKYVYTKLLSAMDSYR